MDNTPYGLDLQPGQNNVAAPVPNLTQKPGQETHQPTSKATPRHLPSNRQLHRQPITCFTPAPSVPLFKLYNGRSSPSPRFPHANRRAPATSGILANTPPPRSHMPPLSALPRLTAGSLATVSPLNPEQELGNVFSRPEDRRRHSSDSCKHLETVNQYKYKSRELEREVARMREELRQRDELVKDLQERKLLLDNRLKVTLDRQRVDDDKARLEKEKREVGMVGKQVTAHLEQVQRILNEMQEKHDVGQADPYWLHSLFEALHAWEGKAVRLDALLGKLSKRLDASRRDGAKETGLLAMQVASPILQLMRNMDREGCEVTDEMIRQSSKEVRELADTTEDGIQKVLGQLNALQGVFVDRLDTLQVLMEDNTRLEAELRELQKTLDEVKGDRDRWEQLFSSSHPRSPWDFEETPNDPIEDDVGASHALPRIEFCQYLSRPNTSPTRHTGSMLWNWNPVDFVSFLSPKVADNHHDLSLIETTMAERFFARAAYRAVRYKHRHFHLYSEVRIPCAAEGQGPLIIGKDPPSIGNWGTWNCVNAMMQNSDNHCYCPDEASYCLRYQVWSISSDTAGSTQNILKLMWFEIDPSRTGWDVLRAMGNNCWTPVNFVMLFSGAKDAAENHPQWCDMSVVDDFFVTLIIGDSSGRREECFQNANYFLEDAELDESGGVISNHCDVDQPGASISDWHRELDQDQDMDNWRCLNFVLVISEEEAEKHLRSVRQAHPDRQEQDGWLMETCCCPAHTPFCLAIRLETRNDTSGESYKVVRIKWIRRRDPSYESGRVLGPPVWVEADPEVEEKLKQAFAADMVEEYDEDETDDDDQQTNEDEEMGSKEDKGELSSLFSGSDDGDVGGEDQGESSERRDENVAEDTGEDQDGSPGTLDFEHPRAYSPRRSLPGLDNRLVMVQRRPRSDEDEGGGRSKRRRVDNTTDSTEHAEGSISGIGNAREFKETGKW